MKLTRIEVFNFRKLRRARLDMSDKQTLLVGANNSGKTSAMKALRKFLKDRGGIDTRDVTASNWAAIEQIAGAWTQEAEADLSPLLAQLPFLDVWLHADTSELHHVAHLIPTLTWTGGLLGVRLRLEPKKGADIKAGYLAARRAAEALQPDGATANGFALWPRDFREFLDKRLKDLFELNAHLLDPGSFTASGAVSPPPLPPLSEGVGPNPFAGLLHIREINAQRGFADAGDGKGDDGELVHAASRKIASQIQPYFRKHIDPETDPTPNDVKALIAIHDAETTFNARLKDGFANAITELEELGYPGGLNNPKLSIATQIKPVDGLDHPAAVQYDISGDTSGVKLPESYNGLGFQNLISMVFQLMRFRDDWMQVGKFKSQVVTPDDRGIEPLQLVLIEEPEAHLHVQVQHVFMAKAHKVLRNHKDLEKEDSAFTTQLVVSTHSGHIAHAAAFEELRYFKRELPGHRVVPTATVANMTGLFGADAQTRRFVTRYLLSTHFDLFFADAIIVIEGAAERILLPHLIQHHYPDLAVAYLSFLELGGQPRTPHASLDRGAGSADADHHRSRCRGEGRQRRKDCHAISPAALGGRSDHREPGSENLAPRNGGGRQADGRTAKYTLSYRCGPPHRRRISDRARGDAGGADPGHHAQHVRRCSCSGQPGGREGRRKGGARLRHDPCFCEIHLRRAHV